MRGQVLAELSKLRRHKRRKRGWGWVILLAIVLTLFLFAAFFSSQQVPAPVTMSEVPEAVLKKREPEKEVQTEGLATEKKEKTEVFYMGIRISR